jgi:outer membrane beta-barrel protein
MVTAARSAATLLMFGCVAATAARANASDCESPPPTTATPTTDAPASTPTPSEPQPPADPQPPTDATADPSTPAADATPDSTAEALGRTARRVKCLDESMIDEFGRTAVRKGVQPRDFRKAMRVAIALGGGVRAGDLLDTQWQAGANLAFWPFEDLGFDVDFKLSPMTLRVERSATSFTGEDRYPDGIVANLSYSVLGHVLFSPFHTKLRARGDRIIHGDFVLIGGGGAVLHSSVQAAAFDLGVGFYLFPAKFVSLRLDLVDRIMAQEAIGSRRISNDLVFSAGVAFWIPPRRR